MSTPDELRTRLRNISIPSEINRLFRDFLDSTVVKDSAEDLAIISYTESGTTENIQSSGAITLDLDGRIHEHTLAANVTAWTLTPPTAPKCGSVVLILIQTEGAYTVAYPATWYWVDGDAVTMPVGAGEMLELVLRSTPSGKIFASANVMAQV